MSNPDKKNPYRELAKLLREVPEEQRMLVSGVLRGSVGDVDCGCAFGAAYPESDKIDVGDLATVYAVGFEDAEVPARAMSNYEKFYLWVRNLGGDVIFVNDVMNANDGYYTNGNTPLLARKRYEHMLRYLDGRAETFDEEASFVGEVCQEPSS